MQFQLPPCTYPHSETNWVLQTALLQPSTVLANLIWWEKIGSAYQKMYHEVGCCVVVASWLRLMHFDLSMYFRGLTWERLKVWQILSVTIVHLCKAKSWGSNRGGIIASCDIPRPNRRMAQSCDSKNRNESKWTSFDAKKHQAYFSREVH